LADYAIETIDLVKRYPASVRKRGPSLTRIFRVLKRKGPFIEALRGVTLRVRRGEIFGLLGPNGAGKTTLIKILCTLVLPDEGEAYVNGFSVQREPRKVLKNLQVVFSETKGFEWRLTARQNLEFYALLYGLSKEEAKKRIDYLLDLTSLKSRENDAYQKYSTGMARRLLLCKALLLDSPVLLFDEPTVGLDPGSARDFRSLLRDSLSRKQGKTILISTHNLWEAQEICDRIAIIDRGRIVVCDAPDNIRLLLGDDKTVKITFEHVTFNKKHEGMLKKLLEITNVKKATPNVDADGTLRTLHISADRKLDLHEVLDVIMSYSLRVKSINVVEPTLEEAFINITRRKDRKWAL